MSFVDFLKAAAGSGPLEWIAVVFGIVSVYLSVREKIWSWPTAIVSVSLYIYVFFGVRLYADMGLQVYFLAISFYGWWNWLYGGANHTELHVTRISTRSAVMLTGIGIIATAALSHVLGTYTQAAIPWADSALAVASLIAQYLMTRKVLENWAIWVAVDVGSIAMYVYKGLYPTTFLYAVYLVLATMGWFEWKRSLKAAPAPVAA
ncbi:nicotinamide riboside transporter PnuC [Longimicrobium sp.]|uniref:nicotinamide riboside transporter PnuC n=1 Tax=Longimicrobium sp. TaxID=2029185 RepID=UPI002C76BDDB|nr:nicotinamide riboside transporter PnuC [Longimicrobium sp.]HSU17870.1 nicotinamide riboside transporter PnuC [Longimicrobium sp.]